MDSNQQIGQESILHTDCLTKTFPGVIANESISIDIKAGEIHCLLGENGAGKSTLSKCLYGFYKPDSGGIYLKGKPVVFKSPKDAVDQGIGMVHQHFMLIRSFTVLENIALGEKKGTGLINYEAMEEKIQALCTDYGISLDLNAKIWQLSVGQQQWVEIIKVLYVGAEVLILDEPTAVLTPIETEKLFVVLDQMRQQGLSIIFITHKLKEVIQISDRVSVLRKGKLVNTVQTSDVSKEDLAMMMVGREIVFRTQKEEISPGAPILEVSDLTAFNDRGQLALNKIAFKLHQKEILGIAGVSGNGQKELFEVLIGVRKYESGHVLYEGHDITKLPPGKRKQLGIAHIPDDRISEGLIQDFSVAENLILGQQNNSPYRKGAFLNQAAILKAANKMISAFSIATPSAQQKVKTLSGGNLQKVILARELNQNPNCLLANQPTRGLDVGIVEYVHQQLLLRCGDGVGILLISEDLDEILAICSRIAVMFKGQIVGLFKAEDASLEEIGMLMAGMGEALS
jgi:ABC-type uncharacterized transport system ATPase subunit